MEGVGEIIPEMGQKEFIEDIKYSEVIYGTHSNVRYFFIQSCCRRIYMNIYDSTLSLSLAC